MSDLRKGASVSDDIIFGRNSVKEFLTTNKDINKAYILEGQREGSIKEIIGKLKARKIIISYVKKEKLDFMTDKASHQGIAISVAAQSFATVDDILEKAANQGRPPFIVILDGIVDPYNLGAIIRTANVAGATGVIIPKRNSVGLTSTVNKVSAGALAYTLVARVTNVNKTIDYLKKNGLWVACADMDGKSMYDTDLKGAIALVIGNEGKGVSQLTKEKSDFVVKIPMEGEINSLNASVSCAILSYEIFRQRNIN